MPCSLQNLQVDGTPVVRLESARLRVDVAPTVGGRVVSLVEKAGGHEFLWRNQQLKLAPQPIGAEYDPNFYGGIDELLPNDIPETINHIDCPDHGELWTIPLAWQMNGHELILEGKLPRFGLTYERRMSLRPDTPQLDFTYRISNPTHQTRQFLWKLHAALAVQPGDQIVCPARSAQVVDLPWSRYKTLAPFAWPKIEGHSADVIPAADGTMDFFYLFDLRSGELGWRRPSQGLQLTYQFDVKVFQYAWLFASYGGFNGHYTVILEPCTAMPISVNSAAAKNQCSQLGPGGTIETKVSLFAGPAKH
jgi:hypothetical protein